MTRVANAKFAKGDAVPGMGFVAEREAEFSLLKGAAIQHLLRRTN